MEIRGLKYCGKSDEVGEIAMLGFEGSGIWR
jgi:hypothetical protein